MLFRAALRRLLHCRPLQRLPRRVTRRGVVRRAALLRPHRALCARVRREIHLCVAVRRTRALFRSYERAVCADITHCAPSAVRERAADAARANVTLARLDWEVRIRRPAAKQVAAAGATALCGATRNVLDYYVRRSERAAMSACANGLAAVNTAVEALAS